MNDPMKMTRQAAYWGKNLQTISRIYLEYIKIYKEYNLEYIGIISRIIKESSQLKSKNIKLENGQRHQTFHQRGYTNDQ